MSPCGGATPAPTDNPGNPSNPGCFPSAPSAPVLLSPLEAATAQSAPVTLSWEAAAGWGEQCSDTTREYRVCVSTNKASLTSAQLDGSNWASYCDTTSTVVASPTTTASVAISTPGTYYWRVASYNGHYASESIVRSLEVPTLTTVTGRVYASNDLACSGTDPATGYTGGTMTMTSTDGLSGYTGETQTGVNSSATFTVPGNTTTGYQYSLGFANDDTNWIMKCPLPSNHSLTVTDQPIEKSFYVTQIADPWRQVAV